jgi:hypothetical protein
MFKKIKPLLKIGTKNLTPRPRETGAAIVKGSFGKHTDRGVTQETAEVCNDHEKAELTQKRRALFYEFQIPQLKHLTRRHNDGILLRDSVTVSETKSVCNYIKCIQLTVEKIRGTNVNAGIPQRQDNYWISSLNIKCSNKTPQLELLLYFTAVSGLPEKVDRFSGKTRGSKAPVKGKR